MTTSKCRVCHSDVVKLLYDFAPDYITGVHFQIWQCEICSFAFTFPRPNDLSPYYPAKYRRYNPFILNVLGFLYQQRVKKWNRKFTSPGVAFEMGCGDGLMLDNLRNLGWQVIGSERTVQSAYFAHYKLGVPVFVGEPSAIKPTPFFDLIFLFQVLEHLDNPVDTIRQLGRCLTPNGKLIIGVPNFSGWQSLVSKEKWFHLDVPRHLSHFSLRSLETCVKAAGLEIEHTGYTSFEHDPYGWTQSLLNTIDDKPNRLTRLLMQIDPMDLNNFIHVALALPLSIISTLLSVASWIFKRGAMLEIIVKKPS